MTEHNHVWTVTRGDGRTSEWGFRPAKGSPETTVLHFTCESSATAYVAEEVSTLLHRVCGENLKDRTELNMMTEWERSVMTRLGLKPQDRLRRAVCERLHAEGCVEANAVDEEGDNVLFYSPMDIPEVCVRAEDIDYVSYNIEKHDVRA